MLVGTVYNDYSVRLRSAKFLYWLFEKYGAFRSKTKSYLKKQIVLFAVTPAYPILAFGFIYLRKKLKRSFRNNFEKFHSVEDYVEYRQMLDSFKKYEPLLKLTASFDNKSGNFLFRFFCSELKKLARTLEYTNKQLLANLDQYNTPRFKSSTDYQFVPEKKLWEERNHNYKLWL